MSALHHLTVERVVFDFKEPLMMGIRNGNPNILALLTEMKENIDFSVIDKDMECTKALNIFWQEYEKAYKRGNDISPNILEEYGYSKKNILSRIVNRIKTEIRYAKQKIRRF